MRDTDRVTDTIWQLVPAATRWLDAANGRDDAELSCRMLKVTEEAGEVASAWIGLRGQNPRKGVTHTKEGVAAELADVVITALVAIESLGLNARDTLETTAAKVHARIADL
jgi:NTP pyrophosphatase (non-canonical NTP hydrolase)